MRFQVEKATQNDFPIIVISLKDDLDRRSFIQSQLDGMGLPFSFFDAVDGRKKLPEIHECKLNRKQTESRIGRTMRDAEYACALSHASVYSNMISNQWSGAVILEDDAILSTRFKQFIQEGHYRSYSMLFLAHGAAYARRNSRITLFQGCDIYKLITNPDRTTAYCIQAITAQKLLEMVIPICQPIDNWPCEVSELEAYIAHPSIVGFDKDIPTTISGRASNSRRGASRFVMPQYWKLKAKKISGIRIPSSNEDVD